MKYLLIIEDYFLGKLEGAKLEQFKVELNSNPEFRNEFEIYKKALKFILSQEKSIASDVSKMIDFELNPNHLLDIKKYKNLESTDENRKIIYNILEAENERLTKKVVLKSILIKFLKIAAIVFLVIGFSISGIIFIPKYTSNNQKLFNKFYTPFEYPNITRSISKEINPSIYNGLLFYNEADYDKAVLELSSVNDSLIYDDAIFIVEGISYIELEKYNLAIERFKLVDKNSLLFTTSLWYQGLCYLKINEPQYAKQVFNTLRSIEPYYQRRSKKLLRYL